MKIGLNHFSKVEIGHFCKYSMLAKQTYDMRMRLTPYWKIVILKMVDEFTLHFLNGLKLVVEEELEAELVNDVVSARVNEIGWMMERSPRIAGKRERLKKRTKIAQGVKDGCRQLNGR